LGQFLFHPYHFLFADPKVIYDIKGAQNCTIKTVTDACDRYHKGDREIRGKLGKHVKMFERIIR